MPYETTKVAKLGSLQQLSAALAANAADLPQLEQNRLQFDSLLANLLAVAQQQAALVASKQEASKQLALLLAECQRLATNLRGGVKQHYGIRSEKLAEFNLQPFRGRPRKEKPSPEGQTTSSAPSQADSSESPQ